MTAEIEGMRVTISADASQAIRTIQDFQMKFRSMANQINGTMINVNANMGEFTNSIQDIGNVANIVQMQKMNDTLKGMNSEEIINFLKTNKNGNKKKKLQEEALKSAKRYEESMKSQNKQLDKYKKNWLAFGVVAAAALYGIIRASSLVQIWMAELSGIFGYFTDTALTPLAPFFEGILNLLWLLADVFATLDPGIQAVVGAFGLLLVVGGTIATFIGWVTGTTGFAIIVTVLEAVAGALGLPVIATAILIAAIIAAVVIIWVHWNDITTFLANAWDVAVTKITTAWDGVKTYLLGVWDGIKNAVSNAWDSIKNIITGAVQTAYDTIVEIISKIKSAITSIPGVQSAINIVQGGYQGVKSYLGYAQGTDYVPATGIYKLHAGEQVIPKGGSSTGTNANNQSITFSPTINVNATIGSSVDIRNLATQLSNYWKDDMTRYVRGSV